MSRSARTALFLVGGGGLVAILVIAVTELPSFGAHRGSLGLLINGLTVAQRHITDPVTAVNFDYRAFDTLGEEFILFGSVVGVMIVLRQLRGESERTPDSASEDHTFGGASEALRGLALVLLGPVIVLGGYIVAHGQITPGGGFQGGVILAAPPLLIFLAGSYLGLRRVAPHAFVEAAESAGAAGYALIGLGGLIFAGVFFRNFLGFGTPAQILSGGAVPLSNIAVSAEVSGAFLLLWTEFLDQALLIRGRK